MLHFENSIYESYHKGMKYLTGSIISWSPQDNVHSLLPQQEILEFSQCLSL